jgi:hypothetical protein
LADACGGDVAGADKPSSACETFLKGSEKAEQQWELEKRFQVLKAASNPAGAAAIDHNLCAACS